MPTSSTRPRRRACGAGRSARRMPRRPSPSRRRSSPPAAARRACPARTSRGSAACRSSPVRCIAALAAERIGRVVVTTDDDAIAEAARDAGAEIVARPAELAGDDRLERVGAAARPRGARSSTRRAPTASSCSSRRRRRSSTPPTSTPRSSRVASGERDSVFSAAPSHVFLWRDDAGRGAAGVNHDAAAPSAPAGPRSPSTSRPARST